MPRLAALVVSALALTAPPLMAEGWSISNLGPQDSTDVCMDKARNLINRYMFSYGGGETGADTWSVYGYDLEPGPQDVVITCATTGGVVGGMLVIQGESEAELRGTVSQRLNDMWDEM